MWSTWLETVLGLMKSRCAISPWRSPSLIRSRICCSRLVRLSLRVGGLWPRARDQVLQPRDQLPGQVWAHEVVVGLQHQPGDAVVRLGADARDEDDRRLEGGVRLQLAAHLVAAESLERDLEDDGAGLDGSRK